MARCKNHPDVESRYCCMKHQFFLCEDCVKCVDSEIYCRFRTSCIVHFMDKKGGGMIDVQTVSQK